MDITLYTSLGSGNSYKAELLLRILRLPFESRPVNLRLNEHRSAAFLARNPFGQIPVLVDGNDVITDSHAILFYLAGRYGGTESASWAPLEPLALARVVRWLSVSANEIQNGLAMPRAIKLLGWELDYTQAVRIGYRILGVMDAHLAEQTWLAARHPTIADIACYPYVALAAEGGVDTRPYAHVRRWLAEFEAIPRFWPMPRIPNLPPVPLAPPPVDAP